ncbi:hypothetical protein PBI_TRISCUIT_53 [Microbacterium phage Triscuit]|nr:hypothetical protein PBI_TRISCUIT_53 [Microbacterium phage Triscuit]
MARTDQHMAARGDQDLLNRFIAKAEMMDIENASGMIQGNMAKLINTVVADGQKVSDVYSYAAESRQAYIDATPLPAGQNLGAVTDAHIETAINELIAEQQANQSPDA